MLLFAGQESDSCCNCFHFSLPIRVQVLEVQVQSCWAESDCTLQELCISNTTYAFELISLVYIWCLFTIWHTTREKQGPLQEYAILTYGIFSPKIVCSVSANSQLCLPRPGTRPGFSPPSNLWCHSRGQIRRGKIAKHGRNSGSDSTLVDFLLWNW